MAGLCVKMLKLLLFISTSIPFCLTNNIDINVSPIRKRGTVGSYFGFSVTGMDYGSNSWVAVGSPKANSTKILFDGNPVEETGALYNCPMDMNPNDCSDISVAVLNRVTQSHTFNPTNGWYGVSLAGGRKAEDLLVCSHRVTVKYCNTARQCKFGLPGGCLNAVSRSTDFGSRFTFLVIDEDNKGDLSGSTEDDRQVSYKRSQFGQTGIGSTAAKFGQANFLAGVVGEQSWTGAVVNQNVKKSASTEQYAYGGYSLASGAFFTSGETAYAFSAPRYQLKGAVFVDKTLDNITSAIIITGPQDGSYFGMSICASDFDGDQISEIAVGAPYYTESRNEPASGMVYVYSNKNSFKKPIRTLKAKKSQAHALYGRCVAAIGDVDLDGYNDLGVGAPYEEDGGGALYIYHGSSTGLYDKAVQIIHAKDLPFTPSLNTFGWSVKGQVDLDQNGYPDLVVGAYASDSIVILRSLPIAMVTSSYILSPALIDVSNRNCSVDVPNKGNIKTVCFDVEIHAYYVDRANKMKNEIELTFVLEADTLVKDPKKRRVRFQDNDLATLKIENKKVENGKNKLVFKTRAYILTDLCPDCEDKISPFPDIELKLTPEVPVRPQPPPVPQSGSPPSLEKYFQLPFYTQDVDFKNVTSRTLVVKRQCNPCEPNLKIENIGTTTISVKAQRVHLKIEISNSVDKAYDVVSEIVLPPKLRAVPCTTFEGLKCLWYECEVRKNETEMSCNLGHINANMSKKYAIELDTIQASQSTGKFDVIMNVTSGNPEKPALLGDNTLELVLTVASKADIYIFESAQSTDSRYFGGSVRGQFSMKHEEQIGLTVEHRYVVGNKGPDVVPEVNITVQWPYEAKNGKHLLYLLAIKEDSKMKCFPKPKWVNPLANQFKKKEVFKRIRRDAAGDATDGKTSPVAKQQVRKGGSSKVVLDCQNDTAKCHQIYCTVKNLKKETVGVTFLSRIWNGTLLEDFKGRDVVVVSHARIVNFTHYVTDPDQSNHGAEVHTGFFPASPKTTKKGIAVWIIVVSAIAGVVLLVILIVVFKMCGFFKRMDTAQYDPVPADT